MTEKLVLRLNTLIAQAYDCRSFDAFLRLTITSLHKLVAYDSGLFFCAISHDSSFFKPYTGGDTIATAQKQPFLQRETYLEEHTAAGAEVLVYKALDYRHGLVQVPQEPRSDFLSSQSSYHVACMRILYKGQFLGEIYLHRDTQQPDFSDQDLLLLQLLQPHISGVFHLIHTYVAASVLETDKKGLDRKGLCLFDAAGNLIAGNMAGLEILNNSTRFGSSVLYHLKEILCDFAAEQPQGKSGVAYRREVLQTPGSELWVELFLRKGGRKKSKDRFCAVLEFADETQRVEEYRFKFTKREADIIDGVLQGKGNSAIATALSLSENTVKTHLQNIFQKTGAGSRSELVYLLMLHQ